MRLFAVDTFMLNNAGAYITQELGCALAWGAQWLTMLTEAGLKACDVAKRIKFNMGISSNYFMETSQVPCRPHAVGRDRESLRARSW